MFFHVVFWCNRVLTEKMFLSNLRPPNPGLHWHWPSKRLHVVLVEPTGSQSQASQPSPLASFQWSGLHLSRIKPQSSSFLEGLCILSLKVLTRYTPCRRHWASSGSLRCRCHSRISPDPFRGCCKRIPKQS